MLLHDAKQRGTFHSARWQRDYSPDLCWISTTVGRQRLPPLWFLVTSPTVSTDLQLFTLASSFPSSEESNAEDGPSGKLTGLAILSPQNVTPVNNISVEKLYQRFCGAMQKAARHSIPRRFRPTYTQCLDEECQDLVKQYEESGDRDIADHLIESLDVARRHRWEELTSKMNFTHSSRKS